MMKLTTNAALPGLLSTGAPFILVLLGSLGVSQGAAAAEVRGSWFSPKPAVTGNAAGDQIGTAITASRPIVSHAVFLSGSGRGSTRSARWLVADQESEATQPVEMPPGAKVTRDQAIAIALKAVPGRATKVEVEEQLGKLVYTVEVIPPSGAETDVFVDVMSGNVVGTEQ